MGHGLSARSLVERRRSKERVHEDTVYPEGCPLSPMLRLPSPGDLENVKMYLEGSCSLVVFILFYLLVGLSVGMCAVCMQEPMDITRRYQLP